MTKQILVALSLLALSFCDGPGGLNLTGDNALSEGNLADFSHFGGRNTARSRSSSGDSSNSLASRRSGSGRRFSIGGTGGYYIDKDGYINGPNVTVIKSGGNSHYTGSPFNGRARAINYHATAGNSCSHSIKQPHVTICKDGRVLSTGPVTHMRRRAEGGANEYTLNIEFVADYSLNWNDCKNAGYPITRRVYRAGKPALTGSRGHFECYQPLTAQQKAVGQQITRLMSQHSNIPCNRFALPVRTSNDYYGFGTYVANSGGGRTGLGINENYLKKGVIMSAWTRYNPSNGGNNHGDLLRYNDARAMMC